MSIIIPTIFIGVGGTGKEVLLRIRRRLYTKYRVKKLPVTRFIWMDTDANGIRRTPDCVDKMVDLDSDERIALEIPSSDLKNIYNNSKTYSHLFEWYSPALRELGPMILEHGAGQIRSAGRLAFWQHHNQFKNALVNAKNALSVPSDQLEDELEKVVGEHVDVGVPGAMNVRFQVHIVAGMAGGTGSGGFLDVGFATREIMPDTAIMGHFVLPGAFGRLNPSKEPVMFANGYAALKELDYYISPPQKISAPDDDPDYNTFKFKWTGEESSALSSPFNQVFLIDDRNMTDTLMPEVNDLYQVAAEGLCLDLEASGFGNAKRSNLANVWQDLAGVHEQRFPQVNSFHAVKFRRSYSSYGVAGLVFDIDRLRNAAAYHVGATLCRYWRGRFSDAQIMRKDFKDEIQKVLGYDSLIHELLMDQNGISLSTQALEDVREALQPLRDQVAGIGATGASFSDQLNRLGGLESLAGRIKTKAQDIYAQQVERLTNNKNGLLRKGSSKSSDGEGRKLIRHNMKELGKRKKKELEDRVIEFLTLPDEFGLVGARAFLEQAMEEVDTIKRLATKPPAVLQTLNLQHPEMPERGELDVLHRKYGDAENLPAIPPYRGIATRYFRSLLENGLSSHLSSASSSLSGYLDRVEKQIFDNLMVIFQRAAHTEMGSIEDFYNKIKAYVGMAQREENDPVTGKKVIQATGLMLKIQAYDKAIEALQKTQTEYFKAFMAERPGGRNQYIEHDLDWLGETDRYLTQKFSDQLETGAETREIYQRISTEVLARCGILPPRDGEELTGKDVDPKDAMRALVDLSMRPSADEWSNATVRLEDVVFLICNTFLEGKNAVSVLLESNAAVLTQKIQSMVAMALPWTKESAAGRSFKRIGPRHNLLSAYVGIPELGTNYANTRIQINQAIQQGLDPFGITNDSYHPSTSTDGSLTLYMELNAMPSFYFGSLARYKEEYEKEVKQGIVNQCSRHSDKQWWRFPDILLPDSDTRWNTRHNALKDILEGIVIGIVKHEPGIGFYRMSKKVDRKIKEPLGFSIDSCVSLLEQNSQLAQGLQADNSMRRSKIGANRDNLLLLAKCYQQYVHDIFPSEDRLINIRNNVVAQLYEQTKSEYGAPMDDAQRQNLDELFSQELSSIRLEDYVTELEYEDYDTAQKMFYLRGRRD